MKIRDGCFAAAFTMAAVLFSCAKPAPPGPKIDPALRLLVPQDTVFLAGLRLEDLEKTDIYKKNLAERSIPLIDSFAEQTGVDPRKNLWELLYVSNLKQNAVIGHGKFSDEAEPKLQKQNGKRFGYKGFNLVGDEQTAVLLMSPSVVAVGDTSELRALVDAREKGSGVPPALAALLKDMPSSSHLWTAYNGGPVQLPFDLPGNLSNVNKMTQSIQSGTLYLDLSMGISGLVAANCTSEEAAQQVEGALKALIGMGRLSTPSNQPDLQRTWDGLRVTQQERQVKVHVEEPPELVDKFLNQITGRTGSPAPFGKRQ